MIPGPSGCVHNGEFYADGASIPSEDPCEHCYCMKSDLVCAIQECRSPLDEMSENCTPRTPAPGQCCPEAYDCPERPEVTTGTIDYTSAATDNVTDSYTEGYGDSTSKPDGGEQEISFPIASSGTDTATSTTDEPVTDVESATEIAGKEPDDLIDETEEDVKVTQSGGFTFTAVTDDPLISQEPATHEPTEGQEPLTEKSPEDKETTDIPSVSQDTDSSTVEILPTTALPSVSGETTTEDEGAATDGEGDLTDLVTDSYGTVTDTPGGAITGDGDITFDGEDELPIKTTYQEGDVTVPVSTGDGLATNEPTESDKLATESSTSATETGTSTTIDGEDAVTTSDGITDLEGATSLSPVDEVGFLGETTTVPIDGEEATSIPSTDGDGATSIAPTEEDSPVTDVSTEGSDSEPGVTESDEITESSTDVVTDLPDYYSTTVAGDSLTTEFGVSYTTETGVVTDGISEVDEVTDSFTEETTDESFISEGPVTESTTEEPEEPATDKPVESSTDVDTTDISVTTDETVTEEYDLVTTTTAEDTTDKPGENEEDTTDFPGGEEKDPDEVGETEEPATDIPTDIVSLGTEAPTSGEAVTILPDGEGDAVTTDSTSDVEDIESTEVPDSQTEYPFIDESATDESVTTTDSALDQESSSSLPSDINVGTTEETAVTDSDADGKITEAPISTDDSTEASTEVYQPETGSGDCVVNGYQYINNSVVPVTSKCQESCKCLNGNVSCELLACPPSPPAFLRCISESSDAECCPSYSCPPTDPDTPESPGCVRDGIQYLEGDFVPSPDLCTDCYCLGGEIICANLECLPPAGQNCRPVERASDSCCPSKYKCDSVNMPEVGNQITVTDNDDQVTPSTSYTSGTGTEDTTDFPVALGIDTERPATKLPDAMMTGPVSALETRTTAPGDTSILTTPMILTTETYGEDLSTNVPTDEFEGISETGTVSEVTSSPETDVDSDNDNGLSNIPGATDDIATESSTGTYETSTETPEGDSSTTDFTPDSLSETSTHSFISDGTSEYTPELVESTDSQPEEDITESSLSTDDLPGDTEESESSTEGGIAISFPGPVESTTGISTVTDETATVVSIAQGESSTDSPYTDSDDATQEPDGVTEQEPETEEPTTNEEGENDNITQAPITDLDSTDGPEIDADSITDTGSSEGIPGEGSCMFNDTTYANGAEIPRTTPCHDSCLCKNSIISCTLKACPPSPPTFLRCEAIEDPEQCCPSYDCPPVSPESTDSPNCLRDGIQYADGEFVPSEDICTDCYCIGGEVVCATLECPAPPSKNCKPLNTREGNCCPETYECDDVEDTESYTTPVSTVDIGAETVSPTESEDFTTDSPSIDSASSGVTDEIEATTSASSTDETVTGITDGEGENIPHATASTDGTVDETTVTVDIDEILTESSVSTEGISFDYSTTESGITPSYTTEVGVTTAFSTDTEDKTDDGGLDPATDYETVTSDSTTEYSTEIGDVSTDYPEVIYQETTPSPGDKEATEDSSTDTVGAVTESLTDIPDDFIEVAGPGTTLKDADKVVTEVSTAVDTEDSTDLPSIAESSTSVDGTADSFTDGDKETTSAPIIGDGDTSSDVEGTDFTVAYQIDGDKEIDETSSDSPAVTDETSTDSSATTDETSTDSPAVPDEASTDSPAVTDETSTDSSASTDETSTDSPAVIDEASTDSPAVIDETSTDSSSVTDETSTDSVAVTDEMSTDSTVATDETSTDSSSVTDKTSTDSPSVTDETSTDSPAVTDEASTDSPAVIDEASTDSPDSTDETSTDSSAFIDEASTDSPDSTDETSTDSPAFIDEASTDSPDSTDETSTDSTAVTEETSTDSSAMIDETSTDSSAITDETSTDSPTITDETSTGSSAVTNESSTDSSAVTDETSTDSSVVTDETSSDSPAVTDETSTDSSAVTNESSTDSPAVTDEISTDSLAVVDETSTDSSSITDETSTDSSAVVDETSTDSPTVTEEASTDSSAVTNESSTVSPVVTDETSTDSSVVVDETSTDSSSVIDETSTDSSAVVDETSTDSPAVTDETSTDSSAVIEETSTDSTAVTDEASTDSSAVTDKTSTESPAVSTEDEKEDSDLLLPQGCVIANVSYADGATVPSSSPCQENCKCNNGTVLCQKASCPPAPPAFLRCSPIPPTEECCPSYDCPPPVNPDVICSRDGEDYNDGEFVPSPNECTDCYCLGGEIICASLECVPPGDNCTPVSQANDSCCPDKYECVDQPESLVFSSTVAPPAATTSETDSETASGLSESTVATDAPQITGESLVTESSTATDSVGSITFSESVAPSNITAFTPVTEISTVESEESGSSIITEASVATDGLDTSDEPSATVPSLLPEVSSETELDVTNKPIGIDISQGVSDSPTTESLETDKTSVTDSSVSITAAPAAATDDGAISSSVPSIMISESSETVGTTDEPQTEATVAGYATEATVAVTEPESPGGEATIAEGETFSYTDSSTTEHAEGTSEASLYPDVTSEATDRVTDDVAGNETATTASTVTSSTEGQIILFPDSSSTVKYPEISSETTDAVSLSTTGPVSSSTDSSATSVLPFTDSSVTPSSVGTVDSASTEKTTDEPFPPFPPYPGSLTPETSTWTPESTTDFVLGPGACLFDGKVYVSAQQIPRDDPCDFCFCFRGDIICLQQSCPPPIPGCYEEPIVGFCCPRYECPVTQAIVNITTTTTPIPTYPPVKRVDEVEMCEIGDRYYHYGEIVEEASGPCLECRCGHNGMMECDPKDCQAEPMLRKILGTKYKR